MNWFDIGAEAFRSLRAFGSRTCLTSFGIIVGVAAIIVSSSFVSALATALLDSSGLENADAIYIMPTNGFTLTEGALSNLDATRADVENLSPVRIASVSLAFGNKSFSTNLTGVDSTYFSLHNVSVSSGILFTENECSVADNVMLLGPGIARKLFGDDNADPVGKKVVVNDSTFSVVGIIDSDDELSSNFNAVFVPEKTAQMRLGANYISYAVGKGIGEYDELIRQIELSLNDYYRLDGSEDNFEIISLESTKNTLDLFTRIFEALTTLISLIFIVVSGVGVMNMMLEGVSSRKKEIGLRKALGAQSSDIAKQFVVESLSVCVIGCVFGIITGWSLTLLISSLLEEYTGAAIAASPPVSAILSAIIVCLLVGMVFGAYPASRAAEMTPAEALRD